MNKYNLTVEVGCFTKFEYKNESILKIDIIISILNEGLSKEDREKTKYYISLVEEAAAENKDENV